MPESNIDHRLFQSHRYGLVDATLRDQIPADWPQIVIAPSFLEDDTSRCPLLVDTSALSVKDRGELLGKLDTQCARRHAMLFSLVLASDEDINVVKNHLAKKMVVRLQQGGPASQFRYFDPSTFLQLPGILGDAGMAWLMGCVQSVAIPWAGHWETFAKPQVPHAKSYNFGLSRQHLKALLDLSAVNRAANQLAPPVNQKDWIERCKSIASHTQRAEQHGLTLLDKVSFALHAMQHHSKFDQHERIAQLLMTLSKSTPEDEVDYQELTSRLSDADWQNIAQELAMQATN
jgi:Domain of unknown function (DUF4123)